MINVLRCTIPLRIIFKYRRKWHVYSSRNRSSSPVTNIHRVLFFGTDNFSVPSLEALVMERNQDSSKWHVGVVSSKKSQSNPVRRFAKQNNLPLFDWPLSMTDLHTSYDIGVVVSFGHLIPESVINYFPLGMINVHASLLPRWRGAAPIIYAIKSGDEKTGVSIMRIKPKHFDIGEILKQTEVCITNKTRMPELHNELAKKGATLLVDCLQNYDTRLSDAFHQTQNEVTYAPKISAQFAEISWQEMSANQLDRLFRSLVTLKPLTTSWSGHPIKIYDLRLDEQEASQSNLAKKPGAIEYLRSRNCLRVCCADSKFVTIHSLSVAGKKIISASDFNNGFLKKSTVEPIFL